MTATTWTQVEYRIGPRTGGGIDSFVGAVEQQFVNGRCLLRRFEPVEPVRFDSARGSDLRGLGNLLSAFLGRTEVQAALEEVHLASADMPPPFHAIGAFEFEGALTHVLLTGGAYTHGLGSEESARQIARAFVDALLEGRRLSCTIFSIEGAWTDWFYDVAWDHSFVVFDPQARCWWILLMTDTD